MSAPERPLLRSFDETSTRMDSDSGPTTGYVGFSSDPSIRGGRQAWTSVSKCSDWFRVIPL